MPYFQFVLLVHPFCFELDVACSSTHAFYHKSAELLILAGKTIFTRAQGFFAYFNLEIHFIYLVLPVFREYIILYH